MQNIAIYDLDRTITRIGTFTPFLWFAAKRNPWRIALLPVYLLALPAYPLKLLDRTALKTWGVFLMLGPRPDKARVAALVRDYAAHVLSRNVQPNAIARIAADRAEGCQLILASAAPDFYAAAIGEALGFDQIIATRQQRRADGGISHRITGLNCYGAEKLRRIEEALPVRRSACFVRFYSDHHSDRPVFEWADRPVALNPGKKMRALARARGWTILENQ